LALDRQSIEKRDFPIGRRGYEPASVDAHLTNVAREFETLQRAASSAPAASSESLASASLATIASVQVQAIVEAAETSAAAIEREARENAAQVEHDAAREAQRIRDEAVARSQEHVGQVREAIALMLQRVDAMDSELSALVDSLRTGANRLSADLSLLSGNMGELYTAARSAGDEEDEALGYEPDAFAEEDEVEVEVVAVIEDAYDEPASGQPTVVHAQPTVATGSEDDVEGARLIALNMALNGQSRDETDSYLAQNFDLADRAGLLDEVYATVEG